MRLLSDGHPALSVKYRGFAIMTIYMSHMPGVR